MFHQSATGFAAEDAEQIDRFIYEKTGFRTGIVYPDSDYWEIHVYPGKRYELHCAIFEADYHLIRADNAEGTFVPYTFVTKGFQDMKVDTEKLGFVIERVSPFELRVQELDGRKRMFIIETEYEEQSKSDGALTYTAHHRFHQIQNSTDPIDSRNRSVRREVRSRAGYRPSSLPPKRVFITNSVN